MLVLRIKPTDADPVSLVVRRAADLPHGRMGSSSENSAEHGPRPILNGILFKQLLGVNTQPNQFTRPVSDTRIIPTHAFK